MFRRCLFTPHSAKLPLQVASARKTESFAYNFAAFASQASPSQQFKTVFDSQSARDIQATKVMNELLRASPALKTQ